MQNTEAEKPPENEKFTKIKSLAKEAYRFLDQGRFKEAKERLGILLEEDPENTYGLVGLGDYFTKTKQPNEAIIYYRKCLARDKTNKFSLMGLMNCYRDLGSLKKILEVADEFKNITDTDASILSRVADAHRKLKNFKESEEFYMAALKINPNDQYVIVGLGHLFFACQRYVEAIQWWDRLLESQPKNIKILTEIGNSYRKIKDFDKAIEYYARAENLDSKNFFALYGLAESHRGKKDFKSAIHFWERILSFDPENKLIINRYADSLRGLGEYDRALESFNRILDMGEDYFALLGKAVTLQKKGEPFEAESIYNTLILKSPNDPRPHLELIDLWLEQGKKEKASAKWEELSRRFPTHEAVVEKGETLKL